MACYDYADALWRARMGIRRAIAGRLIAERRVAAFQDFADLRASQQAVLERWLAIGGVSRAELDRVRADGTDAARLLLDVDGQARAASGVLPPRWGSRQPRSNP
ncbi:hypothetical protein [Brevundimonas sp. TWP2-3-4b1]|uniref:hypothetical protein n=1 Tax=Brevundimonas sp. TWP2-3-4b1 TaxID=2804580 RepID=UPI003CEF307B